MRHRSPRPKSGFSRHVRVRPLCICAAALVSMVPPWYLWVREASHDLSKRQPDDGQCGSSCQPDRDVSRTETAGTGTGLGHATCASSLAGSCPRVGNGYAHGEHHASARFDDNAYCSQCDGAYAHRVSAERRKSIEDSRAHCRAEAFVCWPSIRKRFEVADSFQQHGMTAFVLKYRVAESSSKGRGLCPS